MRKVKSYSVDDQEEKDILEHLAKQHNESQYIKDLIRKDMDSAKALTQEQVLQVKGIIAEMMNDKELVMTLEEEEVDQELLAALDQFDDMGND